MKPTFRILTLAFLCGLTLNVAIAQQSDWAQILGPNRDGIVTEPFDVGWDEEPKLLWEKEIGEGFSGPVVSNNHVILFHRPSGRSNSNFVVEKLNADNGKLVWSQNVATSFPGSMDGDSGPKATPLVHDGRIYVFGTDGVLACLGFDDGKIQWQVNTRKKFKVGDSFFGAGTTPIVAGNSLLLNVGGRVASIVAFDLATGDVKWQLGAGEASYSSPVKASFQDREAVIFLTRLTMMGVDPVDGELLFECPFGKRGPTAIASMPTIGGEILLANASYGVGAKLFDLSTAPVDGKQIQATWSNNSSFESHYGTPIHKNGFVYGTSGREDMRSGSFRCVRLSDGEVMWSEAQFPVAHSFLIGDKLLALDHAGGLHIIKADSEKFTELQTARAFDGKSRAIPAISAGRLFARSNAVRKVAKLKAFKISKSSK